MTTSHGTDASTTEDEVSEHLPEGSAERSGRGTPRWLWLAVGALLVVGAGVGYWGLTQEDAAATVNGETAPEVTVEVERETIADTRTFGGTLGFGEALTLTTTGQGVVTRLADQGAAVAAGTELFRIDERPVTALLGGVPMYRDLGLDDTGIDVTQLVDNLTDLGYADCDSDDGFTSCVEAAVEDWQADLGVDETGTVGVTDVVFIPEVGRVDTIHARVGQSVSPGTPMLDVTGSEHVVSLEVEVRDRELLAAGSGASVQLPGGDEVGGTVTAANVVQRDPDGGIDDAITQVEVTLTDAVDESLLGGPADVVSEFGQREDVLTVPVNALVARAEGGHGLEVVAADGTTSIVPVDTGLFAGGRVEVSGDGIDEGTVVGVAGR
jgi:hypothetical protein